MPRQRKQNAAQAVPEAGPENGHESNGKADTKAMTKAEAVRRALAEGKEKPADGVAYIKEQFGIDISDKHFSVEKSKVAGRKGKKRGRKPGRKPAAAEPVAALSMRSHDHTVGNPITVEAVEQVRRLCDTIGPDAVKSLANLFG